MKKSKKKEEIYLCFRFHCKGCPKEKLCEQELKKGENHDRSGSINKQF